METTSERVMRMGDMPPQKQRDAATDAQRRAVYFNPATAFMRKLSRVPDTTFTDEAVKALAADTKTSIIYCDIAEALQADTRCTTPHLLARYIVIRAQQRIETELAASGVVHYVIRGSGRVHQDDVSIDWSAGDIFILPGGPHAVFEADASGAVLWAVGNEPLLAFEGWQPASQASAPIRAVHYPAREIAGQIKLMYSLEKEEGTAARAVIFSSDEQIEGRNILPTLSLAYNTLEPGTMQRAHRHNSVAVTLTIQGEGCYSIVDDRRKAWAPWATTITPPCAAHSHHNDGTQRALFLIVQDGGLYTHARATGFAFV
jgi:gentisate 1,2-dioxygenase